uniref:F-box domain-containing protein n=1 Tax=Steinernema glaseri TaxID=37863 RepID=A0A1I7XWK0_9BILA
MDSVCATFYEDVIGLFRRKDFKALHELSGRWNTVAERHEKKRVVYDFILTQDSDTNAWKYGFGTLGESFCFSELKERNNWRFCQITSFHFYKDRTYSMGKEVSESDLFSVILPFVSNRLRHNSWFWIYDTTLSQEDAARILRLFEGKGQMSDIDLAYYGKVSERFLESHVAAGGCARVYFGDYWPESTKPFLLKYLLTVNSEHSEL